MAQASKYTKKDGDTICSGLAVGKSLMAICKEHGISYEAAKRWERDIDEHATASLRAREIGCHALAEQCLEIADTPLIGEIRTTKADGAVEIRHEDMTAHRRMQIDTRMRLIGKWLPKVYGDKVAVGGDADAPPIRTESTVTLTAEEAYKRMLGG